MPWFPRKKNKWLPNSPDLSPLDWCGARCWDAIRNRPTRQNRPTLPSWRLPCYQYGMICHRSSLIRQSCHFDRVLLQLVDILNTQFKPRGQLTFITETFKVLKKKLCKVWFAITEYLGRVRMFTWKKWTLKLRHAVCRTKQLYKVRNDTTPKMCLISKACSVMQ